MSANISAAVVKMLRDETGAGMMDAKKALVEADGDIERAREILRQKGIASAEKKSGRVAAEGLIVASISEDGKVGVLAEVNCETDFVAKLEEFKTLASNVASHVLKNNPTYVSRETAPENANPNATYLLEQQCVHDISKTIEALVTEKIAKIGENIKIRRFERYELKSPGLFSYYIHFNNKIGVILEVNCNNDQTAKTDEMKELAKDLCMHIASNNPEFVTSKEISQTYIENEKRIEMGKEDIADKPDNIKEKIVAGRLDKLLATRCLLDQPFVKNQDITVRDLLKEKSTKLSDDIRVKQFVRYELGEGIEKKKMDFAEEVQAQMMGKS